MIDARAAVVPDAVFVALRVETVPVDSLVVAGVADVVAARLTVARAVDARDAVDEAVRAVLADVVLVETPRPVDVVVRPVETAV